MSCEFIRFAADALGYDGVGRIEGQTLNVPDGAAGAAVRGEGYGVALVRGDLGAFDDDDGGPVTTLAQT